MTHVGGIAREAGSSGVGGKVGLESRVGRNGECVDYKDGRENSLENM